jgi:hypothetical protein
MPNFDSILERISASPLALELTDDEVDALSAGEIRALQEQYQASVLLRVPPRERRFFDWLKAEDPPVWLDLWSDDEEMLVTLAFLQDFQQGGIGFAICELETVPNYYFTPKHVKPNGFKAVDAVIRMVEQQKEISIPEALLFEIVARPIDIWHFCYKHGVAVAKGKQAVAQLASLDWIVHLPERDDLARYIGDQA